MGLKEILEIARGSVTEDSIPLTPAQKVEAEKYRKLILPEGEFEDYEIGPVCGRGGFAEIRAAFDFQTGDYVALKYPRPEILAKHGENAIYRFEFEAALLEQIQHPNIVRATETFYHNGIPYIPLEFLEVGAETFLGNMPSEAAIYTFMQHAYKAIRHAHSKRVVHCDIKPFQFMVNESQIDGTPVEDPQIKLTDWGAARVVGEKITPMQEMSKGFFPPDYAHPDLELRVTPALDIYGFGKTISTIMLSHTKLSENDLIGVLDRSDDEEYAKLLRQTFTYKHTAVSEWLLTNIIDNCLTAHKTGFTTDDLEDAIAMYGRVRELDPVPVRDLYDPTKITRWAPPSLLKQESRRQRKR